MPFVSLIIPVYNAEKYLRRCLTSAMEQTFKEYARFWTHAKLKTRALIWRILTSRTHRQRMIILPHTVRMRLFTVRRGLP